jgi:acetamidase/formamidase
VRIGTDKTHHAWDNALPPVLTIGPGDSVELDLLDAAGGQLNDASSAADLAGLDLTRVNPVTGPIAVDGAEPGDAIDVHIEAIDVGEWGWSALIPGFGLLADDFLDPRLVHVRTSDGVVTLPFGVELASVPMVGTIGVALPLPGEHPVLPPSRWGGNLDIRHITAGATLRLPVGVAGALLSAGDTHSTMGDGEVCGTGVETRGRLQLTVEVVKGAAPSAPLVLTSERTQRTGPALVTTGVGPDLMTAARDATRSLIDEVVRRTDLSADDCYILASLAADMVISEIVDVPNFVVSMHLPLHVLG